MTKSELIDIIAKNQISLPTQDVELAVKAILEQMADTLATGERIEIRGFGSFSLHYQPPRQGRNPKTGESVEIAEKYVPHFKPGTWLDRNSGWKILKATQIVASAEIMSAGHCAGHCQCHG
ncbi:integration host factor subunit beta [Gammaproteobacteria bacterium]